MKGTSFILLALSYILQNCYCLIVKHNFEDGMESYSYQTFTGVAMYSPKDAPEKSDPGKGKSYIEFDLEISRTLTQNEGTLELIIMPDINIDDVGVNYNGEFRICCDVDLIEAGKCKSENKNKLIVPKKIKGLQRYDINFDSGAETVALNKKFNVKETAIHVFGLADCSMNLGTVTFTGESVWMNPYGHLPGDVYGYLPFYGYMCIAYLVIAIFWALLNACFWEQLMHVQNCVTGVLALCLVEMATWYFDYLHLNTAGVRHHGPFILGLVTTVSRRAVSRMLTVAVSMGYGVVRPKLGPVRNKIILLGVIYWVFAFMFEALIHYNQTEKVETWMRVVLIPPVAIINGIFWWWIFVSLNRTIEYLKVRKQSAKLSLYKWFTSVLVVALVAAIGFAVYEMYYVLQQLYFAEWERLWFMEVGFWQILFSVIFVAIMILWRPSEHFKMYGESMQLHGDENEDGFINMPKPDSMVEDDASDDQEGSDIDSDDDVHDTRNLKQTTQGKYTINDIDEDSGDGGDNASRAQRAAERFVDSDEETNMV